MFFLLCVLYVCSLNTQSGEANGTYGQVFSHFFVESTTQASENWVETLAEFALFLFIWPYIAEANEELSTSKERRVKKWKLYFGKRFYVQNFCPFHHPWINIPIKKITENFGITSKMPASTISICMHKFKIYAGCLVPC